MLRQSLILPALFSLLLSACWRNGPQPAPFPTEELILASTPTPGPAQATQSPVPTARATNTLIPAGTYPPEGFGPGNFPENVNPLTGLFVSDPELLQRRPLAVKMNIIPRAVRPPWGISFADIVYEYYQNAGYTRFHALFLGNDAPVVGPIRSARLFDGPLVRTYKSIFAYSGADGNVDITLRESIFGYRLARDRGPRTVCPPTVAVPLCRLDPDGYDYLLAGTREVHENMANRGVDDEAQNLDGMFFKMEPPQGGQPAEAIYTQYSIDSYSRWDYESEAGHYLRFQDNVVLRGDNQEQYVPLIDRVNEQQVAAENVVILFVPHEFLRQPPGELIEILLEGEGKAYAFRDGLAYPVVWNHSIPDSVLYLAFEDGELYPFKSGTTWFQVVGAFSDVSRPEENTWRFRFLFP